MDNEQKKRAEDIYYLAIQKESVAERSAYLDSECGNDPELRALVEEMLHWHKKAGGFLEEPLFGPGAIKEEFPIFDYTGNTIGPYQLVDLVGEGGMAVVYEAEQERPIKRQVALKILKPGMDSKQVIARFAAEKQTLAMMNHPNIAKVHDAGVAEGGRPYFVMEYVEGVPVTKYCDEHMLSIDERLEVFKQICDGVHHAHQKGIIHRDIKPTNILVYEQGDKATPKIIDFGIAKAIAEPLSDPQSFTRHGQLVGTPEYMSPEQVDMSAHDVDIRTDIYSLGVLLYELLAGVLPYERESFKNGLNQIQRTIQQDEPATPSTKLTSLGEKAKEIAEHRRTQLVPLARCLQRELEWIPMKAMRKDRTRRYRSASELADDIQNYLSGVPLIAGPESNVYRAKKFVRKHAGSVSSVALVAVVIILGLITSTAFSFKAEKARGEEAAARIEAELARDEEAALRKQVEQALIRAEKAESLAEERNEDYRRSLYVNSIQLADAKCREANIRNAHTLLESCPEDLRGWEWDRVNYLLDQSVITYDEHKGTVYSVSLSPDGKRLVTGGLDRVLKVWDIASGKELATLSGAHSGAVNRINFSPDGGHFVSGDNTGKIKVWNAADVNEAITSMRHGSSWILSVSFSPDGERIVSTCYGEETCKVWDATTGTEILALGGHKGGVGFAAFSPNGKELVSAGKDGIIKIWDSASGDELMSFKGHDFRIPAISFNSDGSLFASGSWDNTIKIWDGITGSLEMILTGHDGPIDSVAFSPDDKYVISCSWDSTVRIWDTATGQELKILRGHEGRVFSVVFTPDGTQAISGGRTVKVWEVTVDHEVTRFLGHGSQVASIAFSPDGNCLASHSKNGDVKVWDVASSAEVMTFNEGRENLAAPLYRSSIAFSPDGRRIASLGAECAITVRDAKTGAQVARLGDLEDRVSCFAYSPDGRHIVSGSSHGELKLWDVMQGEKSKTISEGESWIYSIAFSPDGHRIAFGGTHKVEVWDVSSGAELMSLTCEQQKVFSVVFSPDGTRIAAAEKTGRIWDAATGKELNILRGHGSALISIAISPDGRRLVTGSQDGTARVWDSITGDELLTLRVGFSVVDLAFSPDGKSIAGGTLGKTIMLWDSATPADGYGPLKFATMARNNVDQLYKIHGLYHDVIDRLESNTILDEPARKVALQIAYLRKGEDAEMLAEEGWEIVRSADKEINVYRAILDKAQKVALTEPQNPSILRTLGVGQYRVGAYADAFATLRNVEKMRTDNNLESDPDSAAFLAMIQNQLGQVDEGRSAINSFRDGLEGIKLADITSGKLSCWIEAERVFAGENEQLLVVWDLVAAKKLDRAVEMFSEIEQSLKDADSERAFSLEGMSKFLSRACYARGKSRLLDTDQGYINRASDYEAAFRADPNYISALRDLAWLRATCAVTEVRNPTGAVEVANLACHASKWEDHACLNILAVAYSENENFTDAVKWQQKAIVLLSQEDRVEWMGNYRERLRLYQAGMSYSAGPRWSFTEGELVSFWDFNDVKDGMVNSRIVGGPQVRLADRGQILTDLQRGDVLNLHASKVECTQEPNFDITGAISVGAWIKLRPTMEGWHVIVSKSEPGKRGWAMSTNAGGYVTLSINILKDPGYLLGLAKNPSHYLPVSASADIKDDRWHHVVGTYDGERACTYVDGELGQYKPIQGHIVTNNGPIVIGDNPEWSVQGQDWSWDGFIDDVCIYSYALSADEVKDLYAGREPPRKKLLGPDIN